MDEQTAAPESKLEKKRREGRERAQRFRDRKKAKEAAHSSLVDSPVEVSKKEAARILVEERGLNNSHVINVVISLLRNAAETLQLRSTDGNLLPLNEHVVRYGIQQTRFELEWKRLVREKFSSKVITDDEFEVFAHEQLPLICEAAEAAGLSPKEWLKQQDEVPISIEALAEEKKDVGLL